jgi:glycosyltransferase involved in cell wall biosynthesis
VARQARDQGIVVRTIVNAYTSHPDEASSLVRGLSHDHATFSLAMSYRVQEGWSRVVLARLEKRTFRGSTRVIVNYDFVRRLIERRYGVLPQCRKLPYCSETAMRDSEFQEKSPNTIESSGSAGPALIVTIARHDSRKGIATLLDAFDRLRHSGAVFQAKIVGDGPLLATHRKTAKKLGLNRFVEISGPVTDAFAVLRGADVFVLPSLEEQSGSLALLEALQAGVPAVASAVDGICEDVEHGKSALLVPPGDAAALAEALAQMLADRGLRRRIAVEGREIYRRRFSAAGLAGALRALYLEDVYR